MDFTTLKIWEWMGFYLFFIIFAMKYLLFKLAINAHSKYLEACIIFTIIKKLLGACS